MQNSTKCWWCGSSDLSREHKYKKTDIKFLYGDQFLQNEKLGLLRYETNNHLIQIQGVGSDLLKFQKSLCINCNTARSAKMDAAYTMLIEYYLNNENLIKDSGCIDFNLIFNDSWLENKISFYKYCVKHVGCRLVDGQISPSQNMINFLNDIEPLSDIKFVFQIKKYCIGEPENEIFHLYMGPLNKFVQKHLFIGKKITAVASWYTIKQFSINYLFRLGILNSSETYFDSPILSVDVINLVGLAGQQFNLNSDTAYQSYGELVEFMEYFPHNKETRKIDHYNYLMNHKI